MSAIRAFFFALLLGWAGMALADVPVPPLTGRIVDQTGTLSASDIASLTQKLQDLETRKGSQIAVLMVPTTQPETIEQYSIRVADAWKIGRRRIDDGALLVIAKNDRHMRIEVGYGLEGSLTDATTHRIIDEDIAPKFRAADFAGGISAGLDRMIHIIDGEQLPAPEPDHWRNSDLVHIDPLFAIVAVLVVAGILRSILGRLFGSAATGGLVAFLAWLLVGSIAASAMLGVVAFIFAFVGNMFVMPGGAGVYRRGGWTGGSYSGGGWSRGGGFPGGFPGGGGFGGGFGGGGGGFGGGGASGRW